MSNNLEKKKKSNKYDLYDMIGCVWGWQDSFYTTGAARVVRGGSWYDSARFCRSADRLRVRPSFRGGWLGFRVTKQPPKR